jgi:cell wall-associated NlpC family hydrolase
VSARALRRATAVLVAVAVALLPAVPASASPGLDAARRKAAALRKAVTTLERQADAAVEDFNAANDELAKAVGARLEAQAQLDAAERASQATSDVVGERVRHLYMTGGGMALYASVLSATDLHDAFGRLANVSSVLKHDSLVVATADDAVARAKDAALRLRDVALKQTKLERKVADATKRIETALNQQRTLLAQADSSVLRIAEADRIAAEQAAARAFAARLAAARAAAGPALASLAGQGTIPPTEIAKRAIDAAKTQLGKPYQWGAVGPDTFDCSGLTGWAYRQAGIDLPRTSRQQWYAGSHPDLGTIAPGDLLFWGTDPHNPQSIHHVALYLGGGMMIAAPHTGANVQVQPVYLDDFFGVTRPTQPAGTLDNGGTVP